MNKKNILAASFLFLAIIAGLGLFVSKQFAKTDRVLAFENHNPLRQNLSDSDFRELFKMHQDCFADSKRENLRLYLMKYESLDAGHAAKRADKIIQQANKDQETNFGAVMNAFVMRDKGQLIGFFNCREENEATHGSMMVFNVCVRKDKRGQGYGKELMLHSFDKCMRPGKDLTLTVYKDDTKVVDFYKGLGFDIVSQLEEWEHLFPYFNKYLMKYNATHSGEHRQN